MLSFYLVRVFCNATEMPLRDLSLLRSHALPLLQSGSCMQPRLSLPLMELEHSGLAGNHCQVKSARDVSGPDALMSLGMARGDSLMLRDPRAASFSSMLRVRFLEEKSRHAHARGKLKHQSSGVG